MPNIENPEWEAELPGLRGVRVGAAAGAEKLGATLYEVDPGGRVSPLHIHHGNEELLFVIAGRPTLRTPDAERELEPGEVVAFLSGRRGAHQILNRSDASARVLIVSTKIYPEVVEHPDSNKVVAITGAPDETAALFLAFRRDDAVPVTEGEQRDELRLGRGSEGAIRAAESGGWQAILSQEDAFAGHPPAGRGSLLP